MKKTLLVSTALLGAGLMVSPAVAADTVTLSGGGFFEAAYMANSDSGEGDFGDERIPGGFGELRIGSDDVGLPNGCIVPPGGANNFSTFSLDPWDTDAPTATSVCTYIDEPGDSQTFVYATPVFAGFQLTLSYTPKDDERYEQGADPLRIAPANPARESPDNVLLYGTYSFEGDEWGLSAGAGASFEGLAEQEVGSGRSEQTFYQAGVNLTLGSFAAGGVFEFYKALVDQGATELDRWTAGAGIAYTMDAWTFGAQYAHVDQDGTAATADAFQQDRVTLTGNYAFSPGINIDGGIGYSWIDTDADAAADPAETDEYNAFEIGIGTNFTF